VKKKTSRKSTGFTKKNGKAEQYGRKKLIKTAENLNHSTQNGKPC